MPLSQLVTLSGLLVLVGIMLSRTRPSWNLGFTTLFLVVWVGFAGYFQSKSATVAGSALVHGQTEGAIYAGDMNGAWTVFAFFIVGVLASCILIFLFDRVSMSASSDWVDPDSRQIRPKRLNVTLVLSAAASTLLLFLAVTGSGYPTNRNELTLLLSVVPDGNTLAAESVVRALVQGPPLCILLIKIYDSGLVSRRATTTAAILWLLWSNPMIEARFWSFGSLISFGCMYLISRSNDRWHRLSNISLVLIVPIIAIAIFPLLDLFRTEQSTLETFNGLEHTIQLDPDFDAFAQTGNAVTATQTDGFTRGKQTISPFAVPIPRSVWPDKPQAGGEHVSDILGTEHKNVAMPLPAEIFLDFGFVGALLAGVLCGATVERLDLNLSKPRPTLLQTSAAAGLAPFWIIVLRGSLLPAAYRLVPLLLILSALCRSPRQVGHLNPTKRRLPSIVPVKQARL